MRFLCYNLIMKEVLLSADSKVKMYLVPDIVAEHLSEYCIEFCDHWIWNDPNKKYIQEFNGHIGAVFNESDFIDYLNEFLFKDEKSILIE